MRLTNPIRSKYFGNVCLLTQLFGENRNKLFYGPRGHRAIDLKTKGLYIYTKKNPIKNDGNVFDHWEKTLRTDQERKGFIELIASHSGILTTNIYYRAKQLGWGMFINWEEKGVKYRLLYWHIETPWRSLKMFNKKMMGEFKPKYVRAGSIIAIAGNSGYPTYSTAPHLHWELQIKVGVRWVSIDPMPYLKGLYKLQFDEKYNERWFNDGKEISKVQANTIISNLPVIK